MEDSKLLDQSRNLAAASPPLFKSTNNDAAIVSAPLKRLSIGTATATALPPSSPVSPYNVPSAHHLTTVERSNLASPVPTQRNLALNAVVATERSFTPTLQKKTSFSSIQRSSSATPPRSPMIRRVPSNLSSTTAMTSRSSLPPPAEEAERQTPVTAAAVAKSHFEKELLLHNEGSDAVVSSGLVVILHDACYGHRYARPRTSKANLSTIVERPERIQATILGVAAAYVRLGGQHAQGRYPPGHVTSSQYKPVIPFRIRNSTRHISLTSPVVTQVHGAKWMAELKTMCEGAEAKLASNGKELVRPGVSVDEVGQKPKLHEGDLYLCSESLNALEGALGGVCDAVDTVFDGTSSKRAFVCVRPPGHHCSATYPSGFCWLNNVHVGISHATINHGLTHAAIIDFDLHHGDGSQAIAWEHNARVANLPKNTPASKKAAIGYFSLHDINSYPCEYGDEEKVQNASLCLENAHGQTIWNVHLQPWKNDLEFWNLYQDRYSILLDKTRKFLQNHCDKLRSVLHSPQPRAAIFISAGFDASEWESPGMQRHKVNVPTDFYARFTRDIIKLANEDGLGLDGRVISVLEGGYSDRALTSGTLSHVCGLSSTAEAESLLEAQGGLGYEMGQRLGRLELNSEPSTMRGDPIHATTLEEPLWWTLPQLEELEAVVNPPMNQAPAKKSRSSIAPTYNAPTQSYTAKIVSPASSRRSYSGSSYRQRSSSDASSRAPTPPLPDVNWTAAAHELCKLLIPTTRQTESYKVDELNAESTRARRDRTSSIGVTDKLSHADAGRMQLRDRRTRGQNVKVEKEDQKLVERAARRKTVAGDALKLIDPQRDDHSSRENFGAAKAPIRRRLSVASVMSSNADDALHGNGSGELLKINSNGSVSGKDSNPILLNQNRGSPTSTKAEPAIVKKSRAPTKPKAASQTQAIKRQTSQTVVPRLPSMTFVPEALAATGNMQLKSASGQALGTLADPSSQQDINNLASGLKKMSIKLNVPSKEPSFPKEGKSKSAPRAPKRTVSGRPLKKPPVEILPRQTYPAFHQTLTEPISDVSKSEKADSQTDNLVTNETTSIPPRSTTYVGGNSGSSELYANEAIPSSFTAEAAAPILAPSTVLQQPVPAEVMAPPSTVPTMLSSNPQQPNAYGPEMSPVHPPPLTPKRTKQDLPVFTATSPIIFGQASSRAGDLRHIVSTENHKILDDALRGPLNPPANNVNGTSSAPVKVESVEPPEMLPLKDDHRDIWGVPDTPPQHMHFRPV